MRDFLETLDHAEPHRRWSEYFRIPLMRMGVDCLDDIDLVTPECLHLFFGLPPILIMDFFSRILETIQGIHQAYPLLVAGQYLQVGTPWQTSMHWKCS